MKRHAPRVRAAFAAFVVLLASISVFAAESWDGTLVQYGTMREAVGMQNHQGRRRIQPPSPSATACA